MGGRVRRNEVADDLVTLAGPIDDAIDRIRRYCGLDWSGGKPETWAFWYYDHISELPYPNVMRWDIVATAALHPGLTRRDLAYFAEGGSEALDTWISVLPRDVDLADATDSLLDFVAQLPELTSAVGLSLLSKVVHLKRPRLVPIFDKAVVDWYRPVTGLRGEAAWGNLLRSIRTDLLHQENRRVLHSAAEELKQAGLAHNPTELRMFDIAIWMGSAR
jgi:hypothetical protein